MTGFQIAAGMVIAIVSAIMTIEIPAGAAAQTAAISREQQLANAFAPVAYLRDQRHPCDRSGEGYFPEPVQSVLDNPNVALKKATTSRSSTDPIIKMAPTAQDLANLDSSYYLDWPGNPLKPGCTYERDFKALAARLHLQPTAYAHIVIDHEHRKLVLQYWLWYYFNDWNNTHEGDWEMIQLVFDTTSIQAALTQAPAQTGFAQHGGGETSSWTDPKLRKEGDHPVIFPSAGSHGTYYGQEQYIGWEHSTGFGCDRSTPPSTRVPLTAVLLPDHPDPKGPFAWLTFQGTWGERQPLQWSGPHGPNMKDIYTDPVGATANWRPLSFTVPFSRTIGPNATSLFCHLSAAGSALVTRLVDRPVILISTVLGILASIIVLLYALRRDLGTAIGLYRREIKVFLGIGVFSIPIGIVFNIVDAFVRTRPPGLWFMEWFEYSEGSHFLAAALVGGLQEISMLLLIAPPVIQAMRDIEAGITPSIRRSFRLGYAQLPRIIIAMVIFGVTLAVLVLLPFGFIAAIWIGVRWQFFAQAIVLDQTPSGYAALGRSYLTSGGRWWQALAYSLVFQIFSLLPGPLVGTLLMLSGALSVDFGNALSSVVYAATVPIAVIGISQAYRRLQQRPRASAAASVAVRP